jgi:Trp operon repressor
VQERLRKLYRRLRVVEKAVQAPLTKKQMEGLQTEIADVDRAADSISMRNSDLYFVLRHHLDRARLRLLS